MSDKATRIRNLRDELIETRRYLADAVYAEARIRNAVSELDNWAWGFSLTDPLRSQLVWRLRRNLLRGLEMSQASPTMLPSYIEGAICELGILASSLERSEPKADQ